MQEISHLKNLSVKYFKEWKNILVVHCNSLREAILFLVYSQIF